MLKMEKNFVAVIEKGYPRKPYNEYPIFTDHPNSSIHRRGTLFGFIEREMSEIEDAVEMLHGAITPDIKLTENVRQEIADVSNALDYLYEAVLRKEIEWIQK
jgi:hypothetical protein